ELSEALEKLISIMASGLVNGTITMDESVRIEILDWYVSQPVFIQSICKKQILSAGFITEDNHNNNELSIVV
ncbi:MAG: hypothetical protein II919_02620, partial [Lachnospiraceae bacterium]|nr:hypothetical protein [Lachnospiraceae bacterium]